MKNYHYLGLRACRVVGEVRDGYAEFDDIRPIN